MPGKEQADYIKLKNKNSSDVVITIDPAHIDNLPQQVMNLISFYLPYDAALKNLRLTSRKMDKLVENTPAGKLARQANDLEKTKWMSPEHNLCCECGHLSCVCILASGGAISFWVAPAVIYSYTASFAAACGVFASGYVWGAATLAFMNFHLFCRDRVNKKIEEAANIHNGLNTPYEPAYKPG